MSQKAHSASRGPRPTARDLSRWPRKREFNSRYSRDVGVCNGHSPRLRSPGAWFGSLHQHTTRPSDYMQLYSSNDGTRKIKQAVVRKHNKPRPRVAQCGIARFFGIDQKCNQVVPWSLHTFPENCMQIGPAVFS